MDTIGERTDPSGFLSQQAATVTFQAVRRIFLLEPLGFRKIHRLQ